jgi:hypothetical protein
MTDIIDDSFRVEKSRWGTWKSYTKEGNPIITSLTEESCIDATRSYLKWQQEGFNDTKTYEGSVGGKL